MPELPEVETCRRIVVSALAGAVVCDVDVRLPKLLRFSEIPDLRLLMGRSVTGSRRHAKILIIDFTDNLSLLVHFKLAGQLAIHRADGTRLTAGHPVPDPLGPYPHKATHIDICFADGTILYFSDVRQFGWLRLMPSDAIDSVIEGFGFGPEGTGDHAIDTPRLAAALARRSIAVKQVILDQTLVAGVGNIYADEALHAACIHPSRSASTLSLAEIDRLREGIDLALRRGIEQGGAKIVHQKAYPVDGFPAVHGREDELCPRCGGVVRKIRIGGRGTYYCPSCQPETP